MFNPKVYIHVHAKACFLNIKMLCNFGNKQHPIVTTYTQQKHHVHKCRITDNI